MRINEVLCRIELNKHFSGYEIYFNVENRNNSLALSVRLPKKIILEISRFLQNTKDFSVFCTGPIIFQVYHLISLLKMSGIDNKLRNIRLFLSGIIILSQIFYL